MIDGLADFRGINAYRHISATGVIRPTAQRLDLRWATLYREPFLLSRESLLDML